MLSEASFDQLVELPGMGPTRAHQFLQLKEEAGGEVTVRLQTTQSTGGGAVTAIWQTLCKLCRPPAPSNWGIINVFWASRPCRPTGWLAMLLIKADDVETNPGPTTTCKQVWICDICHRQMGHFIIRGTFGVRQVTYAIKMNYFTFKTKSLFF